MNYYYSMRKLKCNIQTAFLENIFHENDKVKQTWFNAYTSSGFLCMYFVIVSTLKYLWCDHMMGNFNLQHKYGIIIQS